MKTMYSLAALLMAATAALAVNDYQPQEGNLLTLTDRWGNTITATNRYDGSRYYVQTTSFNRSSGVNWDMSHYDYNQERANAIALDGNGNVYVAGTRLEQGTKRLWVIKYSSTGQQLWEQADNLQGCAGLNVVATDTGGAWVGGSCITSNGYPMRIVRFDNFGGLRWAQSYDEGGRNYLQGLNVDFSGRLSVAVEVTRGNFSSGSGLARTVVYDNSGNLVTVY